MIFFPLILIISWMFIILLCIDSTTVQVPLKKTEDIIYTPRLKAPLLVMMRNGELAEVNYYNSETKYLSGFRAIETYNPNIVYRISWNLMGQFMYRNKKDIQHKFDILAIIGETD